MPGGTNGWELAELAKQIRPGLPVLLTSGYALETLVKQGRHRSRAPSFSPSHIERRISPVACVRFWERRWSCPWHHSSHVLLSPIIFFARRRSARQR